MCPNWATYPNDKKDGIASHIRLGWFARLSAKYTMDVREFMVASFIAWGDRVPKLKRSSTFSRSSKAIQYVGYLIEIRESGAS